MKNTCLHHIEKSPEHVERIVRNVDDLLSLVSQKTLSKKSRAEMRNQEQPENPFVNHKGISKRSKKYTKEISDMFKSWKKKFEDNYHAQNTTFFGNMMSRLGFAKKTFTIEDWDAVLAGIMTEEEMNRLFTRLFIEYELEISFDEVLEATVKEFNLDVNPKGRSVPGYTVAEYSKVNLELTKELQKGFSSKVKGIVLYGLEDGKSTDNIAKDISSKFAQFSKSDAVRIARTETIRASARGALSAYQDLGIEYYEMLPSVDACSICADRSQNGPFLVTDASGRPPIHPSCRCSTIPLLNKDNPYIKKE